MIYRLRPNVDNDDSNNVRLSQVDGDDGPSKLAVASILLFRSTD